MESEGKKESVEEMTVTGYNREKEEMAIFYRPEQSRRRKKKRTHSCLSVCSNMQSFEYRQRNGNVLLLEQTLVSRMGLKDVFPRVS